MKAKIKKGDQILFSKKWDKITDYMIINFIKIGNNKSKSLKIFGIRFEIWKVIQGYRLSVDTKTTRYIFKLFWYTGKCSVADLV